MSQFCDDVWFATEICCNCGIPFAVTTDFQKRRRNDHKFFYCPNGHGQYYTGKSEEQKLKDELSRVRATINDANRRAAQAQAQRDEINRNYKRLRERVKNGVCPCCTRSFQNLRRHIETQHPEFGSHDRLKLLRQAFGLTQHSLSKEICVSPATISNYENGRLVSVNSLERIEQWMNSNA